MSADAAGDVHRRVEAFVAELRELGFQVEHHAAGLRVDVYVRLPAEPTVEFDVVKVPPADR